MNKKAWLAIFLIVVALVVYVNNEKKTIIASTGCSTPSAYNDCNNIKTWWGDSASVLYVAGKTASCTGDNLAICISNVGYSECSGYTAIKTCTYSSLTLSDCNVKQVPPSIGTGRIEACRQAGYVCDYEVNNDLFDLICVDGSDCDADDPYQQYCWGNDLLYDGCNNLLYDCGAQGDTCGNEGGFYHCIQTEEKICTDSDGGQNGNVKGTVTTSPSQGCGDGCTDYCSETGDRVVEFWCSSSTTKGSAVFIDCGSGGCVDGKCSSSQTCSQMGGSCQSTQCDQHNDCQPLSGSCNSGYCCQGTCTTSQETCTDSDGGGTNEQLTKGTVTSSISGTKADYCLSISGLKEYYCKADKTIGDVDYACSCIDGKCSGTCTCGTWSDATNQCGTRSCNPSGCDIETKSCGSSSQSTEKIDHCNNECMSIVQSCGIAKDGDYTDPVTGKKYSCGVSTGIIIFGVLMGVMIVMKSLGKK